MHYSRRLGIALGLGLVFASPLAAAVTRTNPADIRLAAERYVASLAPAGTIVHATAGHLDERLTLAPCAGELTPFLSAGAAVKARTTVGVRCPGQGGWSIYVPVTVESEAPLVVAKRSLSRGEVPSPADLDLVSRRVAGFPTQYLSRASDIAGRRLRRPVAAGEPIADDALAAPILVERGQRVTVMASIAGIAVRANAVALAAGGFGDRVRVRNVASGKVIEGSIQADGTVATNP